MSETFSSFLPDSHKPELLAGASSLSYGGMNHPSSDVVLSANSVGGSSETASFPGGTSHAADTQLDALQAKTLSTNDLATRLATSAMLPDPAVPSAVNSNSAGPDMTAGYAVADLLASETATKSGVAVQNGQYGELPSLQFLSHETAIRVVTPDTATEVHQQAATTVLPSSSPPAAGIETGENDSVGTQLSAKVQSVSTVISGQNVSNGDETTSEALSSASSSSEVLPQYAMLRSLYVDVLAYTFSVNNTNGGTDILSFSDHYSQICPGLTIDSSWDDIGARRDSAWKLPQLQAVYSSDSGARADLVQTYWKDNADQIGMDIIGTTIPHDRWVNLRDLLNGDIKDHHRGNQETMSKIAHLLATQDNQTTIQLNNIWYNVLGTAIDSASLTDAINQIAIGHATLQTERRDLAHSFAVSDRLKEIISAVQNRPVNTGDDVWIHAQQDSLGNGEQDIQQIRQSLARWSADNGQYDAVFQATHNTVMQKADRDYAATQIGNGWSVQDYRWNEAHSDRAWREYGDLIQRATNHAPNADLIRQMQDDIGSTSSLANEQRRIGYSEVGRAAIDEMYLNATGEMPAGQTQYDLYADRIANGASYSDNLRVLAYAWEGSEAVDTLAHTVLARDLSTDERSQYQSQLANNQSLSDLRYEIAHSAAEADSLRNAGTFLFGAGQTITTSAWLATQQDAIGSGQVTYESTLVSAQLAPAGRQTLQSVYQDWGQGLPTDVQLKTMATAMYHLNIAWNRVQYQSADQLAAEAATYHAIDGTASYAQLVENVSYSADQATALLASALTTPMMNEAAAAAEFKRVISMGGSLFLETVIDQMDALNNIDTIQKEKEPASCNPVFFKPAHAILGEKGGLTVSNSEIAAANNKPNQFMAGVATTTWSDGVKWTSQGNGIQAQGNPFEVWDAQRLKKEGYEWLADYQTNRNNWKAFDEWNRDTATAVSDKTMDLKGTTYQNMTRLQGRILANVQAMIRYDTDGGPYRYPDRPARTSLRFTKTDIQNYVLDLVVPVEPTDNQWRAICQALTRAKIRVAADLETSAKTIDFRIADIA
ncbi:hypothetical protein [Asaia sp. HN010]|uniref:endonuclease toxin domain-containing protein n=1 Tax=Asaia sp. HN010 TaxID=3081233 RepID=UPI00301ACFA7